MKDGQQLQQKIWPEFYLSHATFGTMSDTPLITTPREQLSPPSFRTDHPDPQEALPRRNPKTLRRREDSELCL